MWRGLELVRLRDRSLDRSIACSHDQSLNRLLNREPDRSPALRSLSSIVGSWNLMEDHGGIKGFNRRFA